MLVFLPWSFLPTFKKLILFAGFPYVKPCHNINISLNFYKNKLFNIIFCVCVFRTPSLVTAETLYKNDGVNFEENWQERAIER